MSVGNVMGPVRGISPATLAIALMLGGDPSSGATTELPWRLYIFVSFMCPATGGWAFGIQWTNEIVFETHGTNRDF